MKALFTETFQTITDGLPGGWFVEFNSTLRNVPAIRCGENCIELLSAGNKYLPVTPDFADGEVKGTFSFDYPSTDGVFGVTLFFRYDSSTGHGQAIRLTHVPKTEDMVVEYGTTRVNRFFPKAEKRFTVKDELLCKSFEIAVSFKGNRLNVKALGVSADFEVASGSGKIAVSREHFYDVLKILAFEISTDDAFQVISEKRFTVPMSTEPTLYPLFFDVVLKDYGNCMDAELSLRGGVKETPAGEGNYHVMRTDWLEKPFLKVVQKGKMEKHTFYNDTIVMVPDGLAPVYFYRTFYKKVDWPFRRVVRFMKPEKAFDLGLGFEKFYHTTLANSAQSPSATFFTTDGEILYSGLDMSEGKNKLEYLSQPEKEMIAHLPKTDPRYEKAVEFVRNNHYFFEGETPEFSIRVTGCGELSANFEVILEDAFLRKVRVLRTTVTKSEYRKDLLEFHQLTLKVESLAGLACGVWHLKIRSTDESVTPLEGRCAFEVMSRDENAPSAPQISGIPYLYDSRSETRGLLTDAFEAWNGVSVNAGHYISCANYLPCAAREFDVFATVKAYKRENFLWLGSRCLNDWSWKHNMDLIEKADYVNIADEIQQRNLSWQWIYRDFILEKLIEFAKKTDPEGLNVAELEKLQKSGVRGQSSSVVQSNGAADMKTLRYLAEHHWEEWLDFFNKEAAKNAQSILGVMRKNNPKLKFSQYGPAHIYAGFLQGPEFIRRLQNEYTNNEWIGFWQYEDYPYSCGYGLETSVYFLACCLMTLPEPRIYPEIYVGGGIQGCPDGAVFFAHPPFGRQLTSYPNHMTNEILEFCYASGHLKNGGFHFWDQCGFQCCKFTQAWYEKILSTWGIVVENTPARPLRTPAFVSSDASRRAAKNFVVQYDDYRILDVRNTAAEDVPFLYETARRGGLCAGFMLPEEEILALTAENTDLVVLPPLKGMSQKSLDHLRKLHAEGVSLLCCEDVSGLEDLFGVKDSGRMTSITEIRAVGDFCEGMREFCDDERCAGKYAVTTAEVLIGGEIPVLTLQKNGKAYAALFNVPPQLVKMDRLQQRFSYSKNGISPFIEKASAEIIRKLSGNQVTTTGGRLIACYSKQGNLCVALYNPSDDQTINPVIRVEKSLLKNQKGVKCSHAYTELEKGVFRVLLKGGESAFFSLEIK